MRQLTSKKSADLTLLEAQLLKPCLNALIDLAERRRPPRTVPQQHCLDVCNGKAMPDTIYERAFLKWLRTRGDLDEIINRLKKKPGPQTADAVRQKSNSASCDAQSKVSLPKLTVRRVPSPLEIARRIEAGRRSADEIKQTEKKIAMVARANEATAPKQKKSTKRKIEEPLGTRDDFRRDRASWKRGGSH